jgi:Pro-kumamolisin, activation domain
MRNCGLNRGLLRSGCASALFLVVGIFTAASSLGQTVVLGDSRPSQIAKLSARAAANRPLTVHLSFKLRNTEALSKLLAGLQDPASPQYHRWLTPAEFDARFGRTPDEVDAVSQWLSGHGLRVMHSSSRELTSAATVAQVEETFATTIAASADGAIYSNAAEPRIPSRFAAVIGSIDGLDNLRHWTPVTAQPAELNAPSVATAGKALPQGTEQAVRAVPAASSSPAFGPQDLWTFYDETPPINGATDGSGSDCIGIIQDTDFSNAAVTLFDSDFSLPSASVTRVFSDGSDPGLNSDETEALVDIQWAHASAPGAPINVYIGNQASSSVDPLTDSLIRAVSDNACGTISFTYVFCGAAASFYTNTIGNALLQAAAQGQTVMAATGDWGSAGLVPSANACVTATTQNISEVAADPNVTSVGGTQFVPNYDASGDDVGNVPEAAWSNGAGATGGGVSTLFNKPLYQNSVTPRDGMRDIPDVSAAASNITPGFFWVEDNGGAPLETCCIGGTSVSTPVWAGISKLIVELAGGRLGNMNPRIYTLGALGNASRSGLRDVVSGNNGFNGVAGFNATVGFDLATGWGSPDVQTFEAAYLSKAIPATPTPTATATPVSNISFVGAGPLTDSSNAVTSVTVFLPASIRSGDTLLAQLVVHDGTASDVPTPPTGWISIRHDAVKSANLATSWLYYKVAGASEPASYSWTIGSNFAAAVMGGWRGASASPIENSSGATVGGVSPVSVAAPSLTPINNNDLQVYFYGAQAPVAPVIALPASLFQRFDLGASNEGFALAFGDLAAPFAGLPSPAYLASATAANNPVMIAQAVLLVSGSPGATPTPTAKATTPITPTPTSIATTPATPTAIPSATLTATPASTGTATSTAMSTSTPTATAGQTPMPTPTPVVSGAKITLPASLNLGTTGIGQSSSKNFTIRNSGKGNLAGSVQILIAPPSRTSVFSVTPGSFNLAPGASQTETVTFTPDAPADSAMAIVVSNDATRPTTAVNLIGVGAGGALSVPKTFTITGAAGQTVQASLTIKNSGKGLLSGSWTPVAIPPYSVAGGSFGPLAAGATASITINFSPSVKGNAPTVVMVVSALAPSTGSAVVTLKGVGK